MATIGEITGWRQPKPWCDRKQQFKSRGAAEAALRALHRRAEAGDGFVVHGQPTIYQCTTCGCWHHGRARKTGDDVNNKMT
jgi:hypothetical protein